MACENYSDGSWYCENADGWEWGDPEGNYSYGYWDAEGKPVDPNGLAVTIADTLSSIFGGGQHGYYAPNRNQQPYPNPNAYPNAYPQGIRQTSQGGIGASIQLPKWAIYAGGAVLLGYAFGFIKQGRR